MVKTERTRRARAVVLTGGVAWHAVTTAALLWRRRQPRPDELAGEPFEPDVSVIVPAHDEAGAIGDTLASILRNDPLPAEIVVVDDGSRDATAAEVARLGSPLVTLVRQTHRGRAGALETGMTASRGEVVVRVDADSPVEPHTLQALTAPFVDPAVGAVGGRIRVARDRSILGAAQELEYLVFDAFKDAVAARGHTNVISGPAAAFRREAVLSSGGISRDTLVEDVDLTHALVAAGWEVRRARHGVAWTRPPRSWRALAVQRGRWYRGNLQVLRKHRSLWRAGPPAARRTLRYTAAYLLRPLRMLASDGLLISCARTQPRLAAAVATAHGVIAATRAADAARGGSRILLVLWALPAYRLVYLRLLALTALRELLGYGLHELINHGYSRRRRWATIAKERTWAATPGSGVVR